MYLLPLGLAASYVLLMLGIRAEHGASVDAFAAVAKLRRFGPLRLPVRFGLAMAIALASGVFGLDAGLESRLVAGGLPAAIVWLVWLAEWTAYRSLLDAAIVFQDHVPPRERPVAAFSPAPYAALSFRPFVAAASLLAALVGAGIVFGFAARFVGVRPVAVVATATYALIGVTFAAVVRRALRAERSFRIALRNPSEAAPAALFEALRRNPRSSTLLEAHADRLAEEGHAAQALLEYRTAKLHRPSEIRLTQKVLHLRDAAPRAGAKPPPGGIVRLPREREPRMLLDPLEPPADAVRVRVIDPRAFVDELLALPDEGLVLAVQGTFDQQAAEDLAPFLHLSPLVTREEGLLAPFFGSWRLDGDSRRILSRYVREHDIAEEWRRLALYSLDGLLVVSRLGLDQVLVDPAMHAREFPQWRRAAAVAAAG